MNQKNVDTERGRSGLRRADLEADPVQQFRRWWNQAYEAEIPLPADGSPQVRAVLLKEFDEQGFVFYTNYESKKALDIRENPRVALLFVWSQLRRQVRITGAAKKISRTESQSYFVTRPLGSRLGAWSSPQSTVVSSRRILDMKMEEMKRKFADGKVPLPPFWGGYRVVADAMEFWQGCENRLHDRFLYTRKTNNGWRIERLAP